MLVPVPKQRRDTEGAPYTGGAGDLDTEPRQVAGVESRRGRVGNKVRMTEDEQGDHLDSR